jgi:hypothetical protein
MSCFGQPTELPNLDNSEPSHDGVSLAYGMLLLVAHPEVQDWVHEEIQFYTRGQDHKQLAYNETFPKLKRCLAVLVILAPRGKFLSILD